MKVATYILLRDYMIIGALFHPTLSIRFIWYSQWEKTMNEIFGSLGFFMLGLILVESVVYVGGLYFVSYLSKKDKDDSSNNFHS